jgi:glycosyltransferase involved in cell wall biosynthesis
MSRSRTIPKVVACMPAWRAASFIGPVLASLGTQTYGNLGILISVDACDDGTAELCEGFAEGRPNVAVLRQPVRLGWVRNSNVLLRRAEGEYLFFAFHDDPLEPTYVSRLVDALDRNPNAVLAFSDMASARGIERFCELEGVVDPAERARRLLNPTQAWWVPTRGLFRAATAKRLRGLHRHMAGEFGADRAWLLSLALRGEFVRVPEPLVFKQRRPEGLNAALIKSASCWKRLGACLACLQEIRRARLPSSTSMRLHVAALDQFVREEWWLRQRATRAQAVERPSD